MTLALYTITFLRTEHDMTMKLRNLRRGAPTVRRAKRAAIVAAGVVLPLLGPLGGVAAGSGPVGDTAAPVPQEVTALPQDYTPNHALDNSQTEIDIKLTGLRERYGRRVGIVSVNRDNASIEVPLVGLTDSESADISALSGNGISFRAVTAEVGEADLIELSEQIAGDFDRRGPSARVGVDLETGEVYIASAKPVSRTDRDRVDAVVAKWDSGRQRSQNPNSPDANGQAEDHSKGYVRYETGRWDLTDERRNSPFRTGRWVIGTSNLPYCTGGFLMRRVSDGALRATTAGHCFSGWQMMKMDNGNNVGTVINLNPGGWDFAASSVPAGYDGTPAVTTSSTGGYRLVSEKIATPVSQNQYCWAGRGIWGVDQANERCGIKNRTHVANGKTLHCVERRTHGGDSGGGVYGIRSSDGRAVAAGFMVGALTVDNPISPTQHFACFNTVGSIEGSGAGLEVVLQK